MIIEDRAGNAGPVHGLLQAHGHRLLGRAGHRHQGDRLHVLMAQRPAHGKLAEPNAQDDQTLALPDLDRVVDHPDPVVGDDLGTEQSRQPDPQQPQPPGRPIGSGFVVARRRAEQSPSRWPRTARTPRSRSPATRTAAPRPRNTADHRARAARPSRSLGGGRPGRFFFLQRRDLGPQPGVLSFEGGQLLAGLLGFESPLLAALGEIGDAVLEPLDRCP